MPLVNSTLQQFSILFTCPANTPTSTGDCFLVFLMEPMALFPILSSWGLEVVGSTPDPEEGTRLKTSTSECYKGWYLAQAVHSEI